MIHLQDDVDNQYLHVLKSLFLCKMYIHNALIYQRVNYVIDDG